MIVLAVNIRCKKEKVEEARSFFSSFTSRARAEDGCIQYDLFQAQEDPQVFFFFEKWSDERSFKLHSEQSYLKEFHARFDELLETRNQVLFLKSLQ